MISTYDGAPDPAPDPSDAEALEQALNALKALAALKHPQPSRKHARALLIPLGQLLARSPSAELAPRLERVREYTQGFRAAWLNAVMDELQLACTEFVMSVDERYLGMSDYDFDYTSSARRRLEDRLRASEALGYELPMGMRGRIADADAIYAPYLERHEAGR